MWPLVLAIVCLWHYCLSLGRSMDPSASGSENVRRRQTNSHIIIKVQQSMRSSRGDTDYKVRYCQLE